MTYEEAKYKFIEDWGDFGINWGVNRILAKIHGLLLVSCKPKCADEIMEELDISRGSANTNLRLLCEWELAFKERVTENRKEYFVAEKDIWKVFLQIIKYRKKKELDPLLASLEQLSTFETGCDNSRQFKQMVNSIETISHKADVVLDKIVEGKPNILLSTYFKMI